MQEDFTAEKKKIIYDRLYKEYGNWKNKNDFMEESFGLDRQSFYYRRNTKEEIDYGELERVFPMINREWLYSTDLTELKTLPVKKFDQGKDPIGAYLNRLELLLSDSDSSDKARDELYEYLQVRLGSLSQEIREISLLLKKLQNVEKRVDF